MKKKDFNKMLDEMDKKLKEYDKNYDSSNLPEVEIDKSKKHTIEDVINEINDKIKKIENEKNNKDK